VTVVKEKCFCVLAL